MKNKFKNIKGITLIALIVTIIILLILAGVSIAFLTGENGILNKAKTARENTLASQDTENQTLVSYESIIDSSLTGSSRGSGYGTESSIITSVGIDLGASVISKNTANLKITNTTSEFTYIAYHILLGTSQDALSLIKVQDIDTISLTGLTKQTIYYIKIVAYDKNNNYKASEIVQFTTKNGVDVDLRTEYAKGNGIATASGVSSGSIAGAIDNNTSTIWRHYTIPAWIEYDFGYSIVPTSYYLMCQIGTVTCKIQASKDNSTWVDISSVITFTQNVNVTYPSNYTSATINTAEAYRYYRFYALTCNANDPWVDEFNITGSNIN